jgi:DNA topoisomerase-2
MQSMDPDTVSLLTKRAYDMAGVSDSKVKVYLNGQKIEIKNFVEYCDLYLNNQENSELPKIVEKKTDRWEIVASLSDGQF